MTTLVSVDCEKVKHLIVINYTTQIINETPNGISDFGQS